MRLFLYILWLLLVLAHTGGAVHTAQVFWAAHEYFSAFIKPPFYFIGSMTVAYWILRRFIAEPLPWRR